MVIVRRNDEVCRATQKHISKHQVEPKEVEEAFHSGVFTRRTKKKIAREGIAKSPSRSSKPNPLPAS
jgi:hypothetical protein